MAKETEMEIKLLVANEDLSKLLASSLFTGTYIADSEKILHLTNWYYDTPTLSLKNNGLAYRIRKTNEAYEATVKTKGQNRGGFSIRGEYTVPLQDKKVITEGFAPEIDSQLKKLLKGTALGEWFYITVTRQVYLLQVTPETVLEMSIDEGEIRANQERELVAEVELEIKKGTKEDLFAFLGACQKHFTITPETRSKWQRGMALATK
ncbi:MAG: CYTH domain-containing protein [Acidaminococcaceae bacterium]|jgi:inorganic triphosphatase YgiF|nr:CYTH domain-containing protein [Acidaminococcaceae bacterium]